MRFNENRRGGGRDYAPRPGRRHPRRRHQAGRIDVPPPCPVRAEAPKQQSAVAGREVGHSRIARVRWRQPV